MSLENLTHFGLRAGVDMRPTLIRVLTDLYVQKLTHTPEEEQHYTELALRLLDAVDTATRAAIAGRLAHHLSPPFRVIERLAADVPDVAAAVRSHPMLQRKPEAAEPAAIPVVELHEAEPPGVRGVGERDETEVPVPAAPHEETAPVRETLLLPDIASELNELFFAANAYERRLILLNLEIVAPLAAGDAEPPRDAAIGQRLEIAALGCNREDFAQQLAQALQIPSAQARRIVGDELGEPIVTAAKALNIPREVLYRMLLFVNTTVGHSVERVHALAALYDEMPRQAAQHMVAIWQSLRKNETERAAAPHRPLLWNDEARARARTATVTVRRAPAAQRPGARREIS